jgi:hypothetical protein
MKTPDTDLLERLAPLRDLEPTDDDVRRLLAEADELRAPRRAQRPKRPARAVAVLAATAALIGALAALPGGKDSARPEDAHGILQAAAAVAAEQPAPAAYRYTRMLSRFVDDVRAGGERGRVIYEQTSESWTSDGFRGRTVAPQGSIAWAAPPSQALQAAGGHASGLVKPYDGDYRYGDGPMARVPFAALPDDPVALGALLEAAIRDTRWALHPSEHPRWAPGVVEEEVSRSAVILLSMGNLTGGQRKALFELLSSRPGARSLGDVQDATGREGVGVALPLARSGSELRVIIAPKTSDILQSTEVLPPPPATPPRVAGAPRPPVWPPPVSLAERAEVFLGTGSVAALGDRP